MEWQGKLAFEYVLKGIYFASCFDDDAGDRTLEGYTMHSLVEGTLRWGRGPSRSRKQVRVDTESTCAHH